MAPESVEEAVLIAINRIGNGSLAWLLSVRGNVVEGKLELLHLNGTDRLDRRGGAGYCRRNTLTERRADGGELKGILTTGNIGIGDQDRVPVSAAETDHVLLVVRIVVLSAHIEEVCSLRDTLVPAEDEMTRGGVIHPDIADRPGSNAPLRLLYAHGGVAGGDKPHQSESA